MPVTGADNVLPRIGVLAPASARAAIRAVFLRHVIGGKRLSRGPRFARLVRAATPDAVLTGVEVLADTLGGDLAVVDVGGATTDVYSVLTPDERATGPGREVAGACGGPAPWRATWACGGAPPGWCGPPSRSGCSPPAKPTTWRPRRRARAADPAFLAVDDVERAVDRRIATLAATVALRRHARGAATGERAGRDLRDVRLLVGSGGVLRHAPADVSGQVLACGPGRPRRRVALPRAAAAVVDADYVLAAGGLLAAEHRAAARALLCQHLRTH